MTSERGTNEHHFFKTVGRGCSYSLIENGGVAVFYGVILPSSDGDFLSQARSALDRLRAVLKRERLEGGVVSQTVFLRDLTDRPRLENLLGEFYGDHLPAITYVPQKPCEGTISLIFEIVAYRSQPCRVRILRSGSGAVTVDIGDVSFGYFGDLVPADGALGAYDQARGAFECMKSRMKDGGFALSDLLRTWIYQGSIVEPEGATQRYKELNRARTDFFQNVRFLETLLPENFPTAVYPASTGIGADGSNVTVCCVSVRTETTGVLCVPLENPKQTPAFDYTERYSPRSPKFSRAMAVALRGGCCVYVSGTASIVDSETKYVGDAVRQTEQTLDNIRNLIAGENLARHGVLGFDAGLENLAIARVYVKRPEDYEAIRAACRKRLGGTPILFTLSDVCRDELLVEIEGVVVCAPLSDGGAN